MEKFKSSNQSIADDEDELLVFTDENDEESSKVDLPSYKVLIVDDDHDVHVTTKIAMDSFSYQGRELEFIDAYSASEGKDILAENDDIALILLDVIMEESDSGLKVVKYIRETLEKDSIRIILRTGQPGQVPEDKVTSEYDINDYKVKTELVKSKLFTCITVALRSYENIVKLIEMKKNISRKNQELSKLCTSYSRFVPLDFLKLLSKKNITDMILGDHIKSEMTILFSDIRSFTSISEKMNANENFEFVNNFLKQIEPVIRKNSGFIDKYIGDAIMALFANSTDDGLNAGVEMIKSLEQYNKQLILRGENPISIGVGIHTGTVILGTVGNEERMDVTVISDAVNISSRIEGLTKQYEIPMIVTEQVVEKLSNKERDVNVRFLDTVKVKGKEKYISIYECFDHENDENIVAKKETKEFFENGMKSFLKNDFPQAKELFAKVCKRNRNDTLAHRLLLQSEQKNHISRHGSNFADDPEFGF